MNWSCSAQESSQNRKISAISGDINSLVADRRASCGVQLTNNLPAGSPDVLSPLITSPNLPLCRLVAAAGSFARGNLTKCRSLVCAQKRTSWSGSTGAVPLSVVDPGGSYQLIPVGPVPRGTPPVSLIMNGRRGIIAQFSLLLTQTYSQQTRDVDPMLDRRRRRRANIGSTSQSANSQSLQPMR